MTTGQQFTLVSRNTPMRAVPAGKTLEWAMNPSHIQPPNPVDLGAFADEVTFYITVSGVVGSPTAWQLRAKAQFVNPNYGGFQYERQMWRDLDAANVAGCIVEKTGFAGPGKTAVTDGGFAVVAASGDTLSTDAPVTIQRTFRHFGQSVRLIFEPTFTGGTNPGVLVDAGYWTKG